MNCPYCAEMVKDAAVVCRHCGRDFTIFRPLLERLSAVELALHEVQTSMALIGSQPMVGSGTSIPASHLLKSVTSIFLASAGSVFFYWLWSTTGPRMYLIISIASPIAGGLLLGSWARGQHGRFYSLVGVMVGVMSFLGTLQVRGVGLEELFQDPDRSLVVFIYFIGQPFMFAMGAIFASWVGARVAGDLRSSPKTLGAARIIVRLTAQKNSNLSEMIELWQRILQAITPVLTFIAAIAGAYLTYLASVAKR